MNEPTQKYKLAEDQTHGPAKPARTYKFFLKFLVGFLGWYLVMALIFGIMLRDTGEASNWGWRFLVLQIFTFGFLSLFEKLRAIGWGMLFALGVNFAISLALGLLFNAICLIPFFKPMNVMFE